MYAPAIAYAHPPTASPVLSVCRFELSTYCLLAPVIALVTFVCKLVLVKLSALLFVYLCNVLLKLG